MFVSKWFQNVVKILHFKMFSFVVNSDLVIFCMEKDLVHPVSNVFIGSQLIDRANSCVKPSFDELVFCSAVLIYEKYNHYFNFPQMLIVPLHVILHFKFFFACLNMKCGEHVHSTLVLGYNCGRYMVLQIF